MRINYRYPFLNQKRICVYVGLSYSGYNSVGGWSGGKALQDNEGL